VKNLKIAVIGSRKCKGFNIDIIMRYLPKECTCIISGGARGVDSFAMKAAEKLEISFLCIKPDYEKHGKAAPLIRNEEIISKADHVIAFWDFKSRGTAHTIALCIAKGVPVRVIGLDEHSDV